MINLKDFVHKYDNIIEKEICEEIINQKDLKFYPAKTGGGVHKARNCLVKPIEKNFDSKIHEIISKIIQLYMDDHEHFGPGMGSIEDTGYEHLLYLGSNKGEYKQHTDHMDMFPRILSVSILLNDNYEGGDFSFFNGQHIIKKQQGSAIVFPSNFCFPHAVLPVTQGDRHSIITWIH